MLLLIHRSFIFLTDTSPNESYTYLHTLPLHDALPILPKRTDEIGAGLDHSQCCIWGHGKNVGENSSAMADMNHGYIVRAVGRGLNGDIVVGQSEKGVVQPGAAVDQNNAHVASGDALPVQRDRAR